MLIAQSQAPFSIRLEKHSPEAFPALQSFVWAQNGPEVLILAGRTDGLHKRQPFAAFDQAGIQGKWWVWNTQNDSVWSYTPSGFPASISEQLSSSNAQFVQIADTLLISGGYAYSPTANAHTTFGYLSSVIVSKSIQAIKNGQSPLSYFQQTADSRFKVTGGHMLSFNDEIILAGGHLFDGSYNPMGPDHGQGFTQAYTNSVRRFQIQVSPQLTVTRFSSDYDSLLFHKRDYNALPLYMADGTWQIGLFSGVFQYSADLPWTNLVTWTPQGWQEVAGFEQLLNQYHTAQISLISTAKNRQYSLFFGGIGLYTTDANGNLVKDVNVPFVDHISLVERGENNQFSEYLMDTPMPARLGAAAAFIPASGLAHLGEGLKYDALPSQQETWIGTIVGGIESDQDNVFTSNNALSRSNAALYKVFITPNAAANLRSIESFNDWKLMAYTENQGESIVIQFQQPFSGKTVLRFFDETGKMLTLLQTQEQPSGRYEIKLERQRISGQHCIVEVECGNSRASRQIWLP